MPRVQFRRVVEQTRLKMDTGSVVSSDQFFFSKIQKFQLSKKTRLGVTLFARQDRVKNKTRVTCQLKPIDVRSVQI